MVAAKTLVPVLGVPIPATALQGMDSLLSIVQMPKGVPVGTLAIGAPGAANAGLLAAQILATTDPDLREKISAWREARRDEVLSQTLPPPGEESSEAKA
jgi:5-(carboxyamino)imidazole ribonucleotide mutase